MIINEYNKNNILKGKIKRGFNQTPEELREKIQNQFVNEKKQELKKEPEKTSSPQDLKKARNILKRF